MQIEHHLYAMFRVHKSNHFATDVANANENSHTGGKMRIEKLDCCGNGCLGRPRNFAK